VANKKTHSVECFQIELKMWKKIEIIRYFFIITDKNLLDILSHIDCDSRECHVEMKQRNTLVLNLNTRCEDKGEINFANIFFSCGKKQSL